MYRRHLGGILPPHCGQDAHRTAGWKPALHVGQLRRLLGTSGLDQTLPGRVTGDGDVSCRIIFLADSRAALRDPDLDARCLIAARNVANVISVGVQRPAARRDLSATRPLRSRSRKYGDAFQVRIGRAPCRKHLPHFGLGPCDRAKRSRNAAERIGQSISLQHIKRVAIQSSELPRRQ